MLIDLLKLTYDQFEDLILDLLRSEGYHLVSRAGVGPDGKRDLIISKTLENSFEKITRRYVVQCKRYKGTVNADAVTDIGDTVDRCGADGFILAVTSRVSQPLVTKLNELNIRKHLVYQILQPSGIHDLIVKYHEIFIKYFPQEYKIYSESKKNIKDIGIIEYLKNLDDLTLDENDIEIILKDLILFDIKSLSIFKEILLNNQLSTLVHKIFENLLSRKPSFPEYCHFMMFLSFYDEKFRQDILKLQLMSTMEFISKARFIVTFHGLPESLIEFEEIHQTAFEFSTYHSDFKRGKMEVTKTNIPPFPKAIRISSIGESEFRLVCLGRIPLPEKRILVIDYMNEGFFQLFIHVVGADDKFYYLQYIDGEGKDQVEKNDGPTYIKYYNRGVDNGPGVLRKELYFADNLYNSCDIKALKFLGLYIAVKGSLTIYQLLIQ